MNQAEVQYALRDVKPFKGRTVTTDQPVDVYYNLRCGGYSIRQRGEVVAHATNVMLKDVSFVIQSDRRRRAIKGRRRNVHAWARGLITWSGMGTDAREAASDKLPRLRYNLRAGIFHHELTSAPVAQRRVSRADVVAFTENGVFGAYFS